MDDRKLACQGVQGDIHEVAGSSPLPGGMLYQASDAEGTGITFGLERGSLVDFAWIAFDMLLDSDTTATYQLQFHAAGEARPFTIQFMLLIQAQARVRVPLSTLDMNRWLLGREGAWLKAIVGGRRVEPAKVDRIVLAVTRTGGRRVRFCMTPPMLTTEEPPQLAEPLLPKGVILDRFGQCAVRDWPGKTRSEEELVERLKGQLRQAAEATFPAGCSRWGGLEKERTEASGFFRVEKTGDGWRMVDPDGCAWWSAGMDCVRPEIEATISGLETALQEPARGEAYEGLMSQRAGLAAVNHLGMNFRRAFGADWEDKWAAIGLGQLRRMGFNTVANWSKWEHARKVQFPYVRPMAWGSGPTPRIYRDFPDVFDPVFEQEAAEFAKQLEQTMDDPALVGYFLMNEPTWGFSSECPAAGMLFTHERSHTREELARFIKAKYQAEDALKKAWAMDVSFDQIRSGIWKMPVSSEASADLEAFSTIMADRLFTTLSAACRRVDANHLNLGIRYASPPPVWALAGMTAFDVFSINCYRERVPDDLGEKICRIVDRPLLIGEWHFGALDVGLPSTGIGHVLTQADRGKAYRVYLEDAVAKSWCVGVHYFTMYDQSAIGRFDGENYNIGFLDVCNRAYEELAAAARQSHERMYQVRSGQCRPYNDAPAYLPKVFC